MSLKVNQWLLIGSPKHGSTLFLSECKSLKIPKMTKLGFATIEYKLTPFHIDDDEYFIGIYKPTAKQLLKIPELIVKNNLEKVKKTN